MQLSRTVNPEWPFLDCAAVAFSGRYVMQILSDQVPLLSGNTEHNKLVEINK